MHGHPGHSRYTGRMVTRYACHSCGQPIDSATLDSYACWRCPNCEAVLSDSNIIDVAAALRALDAEISNMGEDQTKLMACSWTGTTAEHRADDSSSATWAMASPDKPQTSWRPPST